MCPENLRLRAHHGAEKLQKHLGLLRRRRNFGSLVEDFNSVNQQVRDWWSANFPHFHVPESRVMLETWDNSEEMVRADASQHGAFAARVSYLLHGRADLQFTAKLPSCRELRSTWSAAQLSVADGTNCGGDLHHRRGVDQPMECQGRSLCLRPWCE